MTNQQDLQFLFILLLLAQLEVLKNVLLLLRQACCDIRLYRDIAQAYLVHSYRQKLLTGCFLN